MAVLGPVDGPGAVMVGYLDKLSMTGLVKRWNRRWFVLYGPKSEAHLRLEYFDDEVSQLNESGRRVIPLRECRSCSQVTSMKSRPFVFQCTTHIGHHLFAAASQEELDCWVRNVRAAVKTHLLTKQRKGSKQKTSSSSVSSRTNEAFAPLPAGVILQEVVTVVPSDGAQKANLSGQYLLNIVSKGMTLHDTSSHDRVATWEFKTIKSYGKTHGDFNFETGRSSRYGAARFVFECTRTREVFRAVNDSIKALARAHTSLKSAPDLQKVNTQKQRPSRAQSMYVPSTSEEPSDASASSFSRNTSRGSVYLENPLQQLRAIHSIDLPPSPSSGGSGATSPSSLASSTSSPRQDFSDHFKELDSVVESPPSYQDALQLQPNKTWDSIIKQTSTDSDVQVLSAFADSSSHQTAASPSGGHIFGADPFSSFTGNDHSFASSSPHTKERNRDSTDGFPLQDPFRQPRNRDSTDGLPLQDPFRQPRNRDSTEGFPLQDPFRQPRNRDSTDGLSLQDPFRQPLRPFTTSSPTNPSQGVTPFEDLSLFLEGDQFTTFDDIDDSLFAQLALLDVQGTSPPAN